MAVQGGAPMIAGSGNVIFLSTILGSEGPNPGHKCDWKCQNEHICGNMYRCRLTGLTHICDKNCDQRIVYDNHSSLCRVSGQIFPFTPAEEQAVRGVRRKFEAESSSPERMVIPLNIMQEDHFLCIIVVIQHCGRSLY